MEEDEKIERRKGYVQIAIQGNDISHMKKEIDSHTKSISALTSITTKIDTKLDDFFERDTKHKEGTLAKTADHETRLAKNETNIMWIKRIGIGGFTIGGALKYFF